MTAEPVLFYAEWPARSGSKAKKGRSAACDVSLDPEARDPEAYEVKTYDYNSRSEIMEKQKTTKLDPSFKYRVASHPGGESIKACFACGVCTAACPVNDVEEKFNPRRLIREVLTGDRQGVLSSDMIWYCILCERCFSNCPQNVNFAYIARALREIAVHDGFADKKLPETVLDIDKAVHTARKQVLSGLLKNKKKIGNINAKQLLKKVVSK